MFNRRKLFRADRMAILKFALEKTIERYDFRIGPGDAMTLLYGPRWAGHPENESFRRYYRMVLDSFVHAGDMVEVDHAFAVRPQALTTIANYEESDRRHRDAVRLQSTLMWLTAALVIVGIVQATVTWFSP